MYDFLIEKYVTFCHLDRENDITDVIHNMFCVDYEAFGVSKVVELKPGGSDIPVCEDNKKEYVRLVV